MHLLKQIPYINWRYLEGRIRLLWRNGFCTATTSSKQTPLLSWTLYSISPHHSAPPHSSRSFILTLVLFCCSFNGNQSSFQQCRPLTYTQHPRTSSRFTNCTLKEQTYIIKLPNLYSLVHCQIPELSQLCILSDSAPQLQRSSRQRFLTTVRVIAFSSRNFPNRMQATFLNQEILS
jgi:hypothetical protein